MVESKKGPILRFKGFTDAWEQRKLGNYIVDYVNKTTVNNQYPVLTSSQQKGIVLQEEYFNDRQVTTNDNVGYFILPKGYFTYRSRSDNSRFVFNRNNIIDMGIISYFYPVFGLKNADSEFFLKRVNYGIERQIAIQAEGTGQHVLSLKKFKNISALFPNKEEQQRIGLLFLNIEKSIAHHQRKLELLNKLKQSLLQKMFPKDGQNKPEIRFSGFTDVWEQRKLGSELTLLKDGTHGTHKDAKEGPYLLSAKNIKNGHIIISSSDRRISWNEFRKIHKSFTLEAGDILLTIVGSIGESAILTNPQNLTFQRSVAYLRPISMNSEFLQTLLESNDFQRQLNVRQVVSAQPGIYLGDLAQIPIKRPQKPLEQKAVAQLFKTINFAIAHHQRMLDNLKKLKQSLLQKMFV
ncbi:restriction endonuclease subunit S [Lactobacillus sp. LC28-10]|uniref:Restriction endonuclease subunit S n=1 Tax=Secundilactobacillus angelensis TaxID=2722706 RepID=A0ABX1KYT5_9LACO|nr:restriction endonuclease subunit S [Secundilactobacillus angelensis]MCH5462739.1 restriction endonuclease subunit S [Secundilactobacillus angelensis]NLR19107.1 restriction endonuclease subunit S [Secundilactobacillus angelensis]